MPIKKRVLRKANDDVRCYVCGAARGSTQIEFAIPNAFLQKTSQQWETTEKRQETTKAEPPTT
jgi:hypothetical protein